MVPNLSALWNLSGGRQFPVTIMMGRTLIGSVVSVRLQDLSRGTGDFDDVTYATSIKTKYVNGIYYFNNLKAYIETKNKLIVHLIYTMYLSK